ncbi:MAG: hypothetical protein ABSH56_05215 [Bryobacteraceae bacterium]
MAIATLCIQVIVVGRHLRSRPDLAEALAPVGFVVIYPMSAVFHLCSGGLARRGFFDYAYIDPDQQARYTYLTLILINLAFGSLWLGLRDRTKRPFHAPPLAVRAPALLLALAAGVFALAAFGTFRLFQMSGFQSFGSFLSTVDRSRFIDWGFARYVYLSQWMSWGATFGALAMMRGRVGRSRIGSTSLLATAAVITVGNCYWSGGRFAAIAGIFPLWVLYSRLRRAKMDSALVLLAVVAAFTVLTFTVARYKTGEATLSQFTDVFDWQMGRFSMIGVGIEMVDQNGFAAGATLTNDFANTANNVLSFVHASVTMPKTRSITSEIGQHLLNKQDINGILPGSVCEFYYNFGLLGVMVGYYAIGRITKLLLQLIRGSTNIGTIGIAAFCLAHIPGSMMAGTVGILALYAIFLGTPALMLAIIERLCGNRQRAASL